MNTRPLVGSSWTGSGSALIIPTPPTEPDPGTPPVDPPVDPDVTGLVNRLMTGSRTLAVWHHGEASGNAIPDLRGNFPGTITTGQVVRQQPALSVGDPSRNSTLYVNGYSTVPGDLAQARPLGGGVIGVFQFQPSAQWMSLINRFGNAWSNPGGFAIAIAYTGGEYKLRGQLHDGTSSILLEAATALVPGTSYAAALIWGPDGLGLYVGNVSAAAKVGSNATMVGSQGAYPIVIGADRAGASLFAGAIDLVALYDGQPSEASVLLDLAEVKAGVVWTNDGAITLQASTTGVFDPRPTALVDSASPTAVVTVQPSNATATAQAGGTISVTAGGSAGSSTNGRFTLDGSPAAQLSVTVTAAATPGDLFENPFFPTSAHHLPIGTGMEYYGTGHPTYANGLSKISRLFLNAGTPFGRSIVEATNSDPSVTVYYNGYQSGLNMPAYGVRIPSSYKPARVPKPGGGFHDSAIVIYNADTGVAYDFYSFAWVPENNRYEASILRPLYSFSSLGHGTAKGDRIGTSASGVAGPFGVLRGWEINTVGQAINHCLQAALPADPGTAMLMAKDALIPIILPATAQDAAAYNSGWAEGVIPYGGLIAIPPVAKGGPNLATLGLSEPGMRLAEAIRDYGIRAVDKGGPAIRIDQAFNEALRNALNSDMTKLQPHMRVCDFAKSAWSPGQTAPFGGGTPLGPNTGIAP